MYRYLIISLIFLFGCDNELILGEDVAHMSEEKMLASAKKLVKSNDLDQAAEQFENFTGLFPKSAHQKEAQDQLLRIYDKLGKYDLLEAYAEQTLDSNLPKAESLLYYAAKANIKLARTDVLQAVSDEIGGADLMRLEKAQTLLKQFVTKYPGHPLFKTAKADLKFVREAVAGLHLNVAKFYLEKGHKKAAAMRAQQVIKYYGDTRVKAQAKKYL